MSSWLLYVAVILCGVVSFGHMRWYQIVLYLAALALAYWKGLVDA